MAEHFLEKVSQSSLSKYHTEFLFLRAQNVLERISVHQIEDCYRRSTSWKWFHLDLSLSLFLYLTFSYLPSSTHSLIRVSPNHIWQISLLLLIPRWEINPSLYFSPQGVSTCLIYETFSFNSPHFNFYIVIQIMY